MKLYLFLFLFLICTCGYSQDCTTLSNHFTSYEQAVNQVENAKFKISTDINTSKSSWIKSAHYYSCDGITGYFIFQSHGKKYIHKDVPIEVWKGFKKAESFGSYYDQYIKHKYQLTLE